MGNKKKTSSSSAAAASLTLREESTGKKHGGVNVKSMLKLDHLKSWAAAEACIPALGAFFGNRLAASAQQLGAPPDPSFFSCQRCESILQPGSNCTVRIQKIKKKAKRRHKVTTQSSVVYKCHFCSHENQKRGTPKGYMKRLCPPKAKVPPKSGLTECTPVKPSEVEIKATTTDDPISKQDAIASLDITPPLTEASTLLDPPVSCPTTPVMKGATLLEMGKRKRNRSWSKNTVESENSSAAVDSEKSSISSSKRKRKSWTSLKEIAERDQKGSSTSHSSFNEKDVVKMIIFMYLLKCS